MARLLPAVLINMQHQNAFHLGNRLGMLIGPVVARNDQFALGSIDMTAPVRHEAVAALWLRVIQIPPFAPVPP